MEPLMRNPYAVSYTRSTDIRELEWPNTTASLMDIDYLDSLPPEQVNQPISALIRARKALMDAALSCRAAAKNWTENAKVHERLLLLAHEVLEVHNRFPLQVDNAPCRVKPRALDGASIITGCEVQDKGYRVVEE